MEYVIHFNQQSEAYLSYRPTYPNALFDYLSTLVQHDGVVWDCGTGNGQAAHSLAQHFPYVIATDLNASPLVIGSKSSGVDFLCCSSERSCFANRSFHLITIAQALHWFNLDNFYAEVRRVSTESAVIAGWCYSLGKIEPNIDACVTRLYSEILGDEYWPQERRYIDDRYETIAFPFKKIKSPEFSIEKELTLASFLGYLNTWSAVKEYEARNHMNPITLISEDLQSAWGNEHQKQTIHWPIHLLVGYVA